ncbi:hypothetical protein BC827DRAFT_1270231 [Russula dissimulans]|nr:hypothetical protein BC827DRAFT_1270231 [Russula dissimulans]
MSLQLIDDYRLIAPVHNAKEFDSDIESENDDEDDHACGGHGKRLLTTRQTLLARVVMSSQASPGAFMFLILSHLLIKPLI